MLLLMGLLSILYLLSVHLIRWDELELAFYYEAADGGLTVPAVNCDADDLSATKVVPELHAPIAEETNLIWCATFQLAWNEMGDWIGGDIRFSANEPKCVPYLNERFVSKDQLDPESYVAMAGHYTKGFVEELNFAVQSKLGSEFFSPEPLPQSDGNGGIAAFAYLSVNLPFQYGFQRTDTPLFFRGVPVAAFTIPFGEGVGEKKLRVTKQVQVRYPPEEGAFIVELKTKQTDHQLILAKVVPEVTLEGTVKKVLGYVESLPQDRLGFDQNLIVPLFNFDITREYSELTGNPLSVEKPAYHGLTIDRAKQNIRFQLDERGGVLRSVAELMVLCIPPEPCIFDEPFLLMIRYKDSEQPYFAMWVDNAEIMVKAD